MKAALLSLALLLGTPAWAIDDDPERKLKEPRAEIPPPAGLVARQVSPNEIVLTWQRVPGAREYHVYVSPPPAPHMANRPGVVGASGTRYVIVIPPSVPSGIAYRASIEAVGERNLKSNRVDFNPVVVQRAQSPGGGPQVGSGPGTGTGTAPSGGAASTPVAAGPASQSCPPGQFVTGFDAAGKITCASPPTAAPTTGGGTPSGTPGSPATTSGTAIPSAVGSALQQALVPIGGVNRPLQMPPSQFAAGTLKVELRPLRYDLTLGSVQIAEGPAGTASIRIALSPYRLHADVRTEFLVSRSSGQASFTAPGQAIVQVAMEPGRGNKRRLGALRSMDVNLSPVALGASNPAMQDALSSVMPEVQALTRESAARVLNAALAEALPTLPEF